MPYLIHNSRTRLVFYHCPKAGGTMVRQCCEELGLQVALIPGTHPHDYPDQVPPGTHSMGEAFTVLRQPLGWLVSYWGYKQLAGWDPANPVDMECQADTLEEWLTNICNRQPGWATKVAHRMSQGCGTVLDFKRLHLGLAGLLHATGLATYADTLLAIRRLGTVNGSAAVDDRKICSAVTMARVEELEASQRRRTPVWTRTWPWGADDDRAGGGFACGTPTAAELGAAAADH